MIEWLQGLHRRRPLRLLLPGVLLAALAGCGGGGGTGPSAPAERPLSGTLYPVVVDVVMIEYDEDGHELQRSTPSDPAGHFQFPNVRRGVRVEALDSSAGQGRAVIRSARLEGESASVVVTPLSTLQDHFALAGLPDAASRVEIARMVGNACVSVTSASVPPTYDQLASLPAPRSAMLQRAVGSYIDALRDIGFRPTAGHEWWPTKVRQHRDLLAQACELAAAVWAPSVEAEVRRIAGTGPGHAADPVATALESVRVQVLGDLVALMSKSVALREYPQLADPALLGEPWQGSASTLAIDLIVTNMTSLLAVRTADADAGSFVATTVNRTGAREQYLAARVPFAGPSKTASVVNQAAEARAVRLSFNGARLGGPGSLLLDLLSVPAERADEPLHARAWRYVSLRHRHDYAISGGRMLHHPLVYLRSIGAGLCDDVASVLHFLWLSLGYESRVMVLEGHVVPEVKVNGRWEMYDPDLKVHYLLPNGAVANVRDIEADPTILLQGKQRASPTEGFFDPSLLLEIYGSAADNRPEAWFMDALSNTLQPDIWIPPGGRLELDRRSRVLVQGFQTDARVELATLRVWLPPGFSGTLPLGLVLVDVTGSGVISSRLGERMTIGSDGIQPTMESWWARSPDAPISEIEVHEVGESGITLVLAVNPHFVAATEDLTFQVYGPALDGLTLQTRPSSI